MHTPSSKVLPVWDSFHFYKAFGDKRIAAIPYNILQFCWPEKCNPIHHLRNICSICPIGSLEAN